MTYDDDRSGTFCFSVILSGTVFMFVTLFMAFIKNLTFSKRKAGELNFENKELCVFKNHVCRAEISELPSHFP